MNHMRIPDDQLMASRNKAPDVVDFIFGGHDHNYWSFLCQDTGVMALKSGCDFEQFSNITFLFGVEKDAATEYISRETTDLVRIFYVEHLKRLFIIERVKINPGKFTPDEKIVQHIKGYTAELDKKLNIQAGYIDCDFEARFKKVRT